MPPNLGLLAKQMHWTTKMFNYFIALVNELCDIVSTQDIMDLMIISGLGNNALPPLPFSLLFSIVIIFFLSVMVTKRSSHFYGTEFVVIFIILLYTFIILFYNRFLIFFEKYCLYLLSYVPVVIINIKNL